MDYESMIKKMVELELNVGALQAKVRLLENKCKRFDTSFDSIRDSIKELRKKPKAVVTNPTEDWRK